MWDAIEPPGRSGWPGDGGGSAGGWGGMVISMEKVGSGAGGGKPGSGVPGGGIWSNRMHPVRPDPSQAEDVSGRSESGQQSQSIASSRKSSVMLLESQKVRMT
jgi:hypothetical protein